MAVAFQKLPEYFSAATIACTFAGTFTNWQRTSPLTETVFFQPVNDGIQARQDCDVEITLEILGGFMLDYYSVRIDATNLCCEKTTSLSDGDSRTFCMKYVAKVSSGSILRVGAVKAAIPRGSVVTIRNLP